jgi:AraC-like DNA-binding protein
MEGIDLSEIIGILTTFISLLLAFFIFSVKSENKISNKLFALYLVLNAIEFSGFFANFLFDGYTNILVASREISYLQMPIFYLYILSVCYSDFKLKWKHLWHITPYVLGNLVMLPRFYLGSAADKEQLYQIFNTLFESYFAHIALHLQSIIYLTLVFIVLKRAKKIFVENYSSSTIETYNWLFQLWLFTTALYSLAIVKNMLKFFGHKEDFVISYKILTVFVLCFVCWYVLKALKYPDLFRGVDSKIILVDDLVDDIKVDKTITQEIEKLTLFMETEKPYLNPSLTIRNLAEEIKINPRDLSVLINQNLGQHFFDFINQFRIDEARSILKNPEKKQFTVLEILYEVGFNSKSSFNTAFKKHTGLTPTQYRKKNTY